MKSHEALRAALESVQTMLDAAPVTEADLTRPTPCPAFDVALLMDHIRDTHLLLTDAARPGSATGQPAMPNGHRDLMASVASAWEARGEAGTVAVAGNRLPATFALSLHVLETLVHGWDLASALGRDYGPPGDLVEHAWQVAPMIATDEARGEHPDAPYGPVVLVHPAATPLERLVAFTGRDPDWVGGLRMTA